MVDPGTGACELGPVAVRDPDGGLVAGADSCRGVLAEVRVDGEHTVEVRAQLGTAGGPYHFTLAAAPEPSVSDVSIDDHMQGEITAAGQVDEYRFEADDDDAVYLTATGSCDLGLTILDPAGPAVAHGGACNGVGRVLLSGQGTYRLVVAGPISFRGAYTLSLQQSSPDSHFELSLGDEVNPGSPAAGAGTLEYPGARDIYDVLATPGAELVVRPVSGSCNIWIRTLDADGNTISSVGSICNDWTVTVPANGRFAILIFAPDPTTGTYAFRLEAA
jgi:hypothetical protein